MDCFAVSLGIGSSTLPRNLRTILRLAFHFGLFQGGMAALGWLAGSRIVNLISGVDHWLAFILLAWVGGKMIRESFSPDDTDCEKENPTRGKSLVMLSVATSIDALAVGLSLGLIDGSILGASLTIGLVSFALSIVGYLLGNRLGCRFGKRMELVGGLILIAIGIKTVVEHLFVG
jgi:putative Mn2+ efflux pump MntP